MREIEAFEFFERQQLEKISCSLIHVSPRLIGGNTARRIAVDTSAEARDPSGFVGGAQERASGAAEQEAPG